MMVLSFCASTIAVWSHFAPWPRPAATGCTFVRRRRISDTTGESGQSYTDSSLVFDLSTRWGSQGLSLMDDPEPSVSESHHAGHQLQETIHCRRRCLRHRPGNCGHGARARSGTRQRPARDRREPLILFRIQGQPRPHPGKTSLRIGRGTVGHSRTSDVAG